MLFEDALHRLHHGCGGWSPEAVEGAGLDQALHRPAVQLAAMHPLAEIVQAGVGLIPAAPCTAFSIRLRPTFFTAFRPKRI